MTTLKREAFQTSSPSLQYGLRASVIVCGEQATLRVTERFFKLDIITKLNGILNNKPVLLPLFIWTM